MLAQYTAHRGDALLNPRRHRTVVRADDRDVGYSPGPDDTTGIPPGECVIFFDATADTLDKLVKRVCAPLFLTGEFLQGGHSASSTNATVTFVQLDSHVYAVTCHHVIAAFRTESIHRSARLAPAIHTKSAVQQFASYVAGGAWRWSFTSCRDFAPPDILDDADARSAFEKANAPRPDIAMADVTDLWPVIAKLRGAETVNLDMWTEPDWSKAQPVWMAYGYPNDQKYQSGNNVAAPMPRVAAELVSQRPPTASAEFTLCSTLEKAHGLGFSGLSGGPVLIAHIEEDRCAFVGITFEGTPSSALLSPGSTGFLTNRDILLHGYYLSPQQFRSWLSQLKFGVQFA